jgi:hypothetical protein
MATHQGHQVIPVEAVEAAAKAYRREFPYNENEGYVVKLILEAAAPYIRAQAWDEGATAGLGWDENRGEDFAVPNPYMLNNEALTRPKPSGN